MTATPTEIKAAMTTVARRRASGEDAHAVIALYGVLVKGESPLPKEKQSPLRRRKWNDKDVRAVVAYTVAKKGGSLEQAEETLHKQIRSERGRLYKTRQCLKDSKAPTGKAQMRRDLKLEQIEERLERLKRGVPSARVMKRFMLVMGLDELWRMARAIFHLGFQLIMRRHRLVRRGYYVCIDENQTEYYGRRRLRKKDRKAGAKLSTSGVMAVKAKKGKNPGATGGHEYFVMTAHFFGSKITLPLIVFHRPLSRTSDLVVKSFLRQLRAFKPLPRYIFFDRGFAAHDVYLELVKFGNETGVRFVTPAKKDWGNKTNIEVYQGERRKQRKVGIIGRDARNEGRLIHEGMQLHCYDSHWIIAKQPELVMNFIGYWLPEDKYTANQAKIQESEGLADDETVAMRIGAWRFVAFFTNCNIHVEGAFAFFDLYRARWAEECTFRRRSGVLANGKFHQFYYRALFYLMSYCVLIIHALRRLDEYAAMGDRIHRDGEALTVFVNGLHSDFRDMLLGDVD